MQVKQWSHKYPNSQVILYHTWDKISQLFFHLFPGYWQQHFGVMICVFIKVFFMNKTALQAEINHNENQKD